MKFFTHLLSLVALATAAHGNGWCNQPAFQKYSISSPLLFSCDDSDLKGEVSSLRQEIQQSCSNQVNFEQFLAEIQQLQQACNISAIVAEISQLHEEIRSLRDSIIPPPITPIGSLSNPASNCSEIVKENEIATTGTYWLSTGDGAVNVTCDFDVHLPPCNPAVRGWQEIANIDMSNPANSCPSPLRETTSPSRRCEKSFTSGGCESVFFPTSNVPFSKLCGRAVGYGIRTIDSFHSVYGTCGSSGCETIDEPYVDGLSLTYSMNNSRVHIWSLAAHGLDTKCPCGNATVTFASPSFVGDNYYCEAARNQNSPLWEGEGCIDVDAPCCENPNLPWFCREFDQPIVTDNIEVRICTDQHRDDESIEFDLLKLYIQ